MSVKISFIEAGYCLQPEWVAHSGGSSKTIRFPATVAVIEHSQEGIILFDTGYGKNFQEDTSHLPESLYRILTRAKSSHESSAVDQLYKLGISNKDIRHVVLSHFHADHSSGMKDFNHCRYHYMGEALDHLLKMNRVQKVYHGFLHQALPSDLNLRSNRLHSSDFQEIGLELGDFKYGYSLFPDDSLIIIPLPGHAKGHCGLLVNTTHQGRFFLIGDASWLTKSIKEVRMPSKFSEWLVLDNPKTYKQTLESLQKMSSTPNLTLVPCHCHTALETIKTTETN